MSKRILTYDEEYGIAVYYVAGIPITIITEVFNISRAGVHRVLNRLGVSANRKNA